MATLTAEARRVVEDQRLGFVATVNVDGTPNLSPKGTVTVLDENRLVFADIRSPRTVENLRHNPAVEINVVDPFSRKGYRFGGQATVLDDGPGFAEMLAFYRDRGSTNPIGSIVIVDVERAEPILSPSYDQGLSETEIRERWRGHFVGLEAK